MADADSATTASSRSWIQRPSVGSWLQPLVRREDVSPTLSMATEPVQSSTCQEQPAAADATALPSASSAPSRASDELKSQGKGVAVKAGKGESKGKSKQRGQKDKDVFKGKGGSKDRGKEGEKGEAPVDANCGTPEEKENGIKSTIPCPPPRSIEGPTGCFGGLVHGAKSAKDFLDWLRGRHWRTGDPHDFYFEQCLRLPADEQLMNVVFSGERKPFRLELATRTYARIAAALPGRRELVILRGPPGVGKSTWAKSQFTSALAGVDEAAVHLTHMCSTDDFFVLIHDDGVEQYKFNTKTIGSNHEKNQERVRLAMKSGIAPLFLDNTSTTWWEMTPYVQIAEEAGYTVRIIEPAEFSSQWNNIEFLLARNKLREASGKSIDEHVLRRMIDRFEPLPSDNPLQFIKAASRSQPVYVGVDVHETLSIDLAGVFRSTLESLEGALPSNVLDIDAYTVPSPLHVTTFFKTDFTGAALADGATLEGAVVQVTLSAIAFVPGRLACAVVDTIDPAVKFKDGKHLHVTLATHKPWNAVHSNNLLELLRGDSPPACEQEGLVSLFRNLYMSDVADEEFDAVLVRLEPPRVVKGKRFRFFPGGGAGGVRSGGSATQRPAEVDAPKKVLPLARITEMFEALN